MSLCTNFAPPADARRDWGRLPHRHRKLPPQNVQPVGSNGAPSSGNPGRRGGWNCFPVYAAPRHCSEGCRRLGGLRIDEPASQHHVDAFVGPHLNGSYTEYTRYNGMPAVHSFSQGAPGCGVVA
jgi:hypothetical protein